MLRCSICSFQATNFTQLCSHIKAHGLRASKVKGKYIINEACPTVLLVAALPLIERDLIKCVNKFSLMVVGLGERGQTICLRSPSQYNDHPTAALQAQLNLLEQLIDTPIKTVDYAMLLGFK
jgi:hypothetical protein